MTHSIISLGKGFTLAPCKEPVSPVGSVGASKGQWPFEVAAGDPHLSALLLRASCPGMDSSSGSDVTRTDKFVRFRNRIAQKRRPSAPMQTAAFGFMLYSISQSLKILSSSLSMVPALANSSVST